MAWGAENRPTNCGLGGLGAPWGAFGASFLILGEDFTENHRQDTRQDMLYWSQVRAGTAQVGLCWRQDRAGTAPRWRLLGRFCADLGSWELFLRMGQVAKVI